MLKVAYFTATFPYVIITAMVIRGCTLEGGTDGLKFYLQPDYAKLGYARYDTIIGAFPKEKISWAVKKE